jgi:hypothetical protein
VEEEGAKGGGQRLEMDAGDRKGEGIGKRVGEGKEKKGQGMKIWKVLF